MEHRTEQGIDRKERRELKELQPVLRFVSLRSLRSLRLNEQPVLQLALGPPGNRLLRKFDRAAWNTEQNRESTAKNAENSEVASN